jgi:hypothetical protein
MNLLANLHSMPLKINSSPAGMIRAINKRKVTCSATEAEEANSEIAEFTSGDPRVIL